MGALVLSTLLLTAFGLAVSGAALGSPAPGAPGGGNPASPVSLNVTHGDCISVGTIDGEPSLYVNPSNCVEDA